MPPLLCHLLVTAALVTAGSLGGASAEDASIGADYAPGEWRAGIEREAALAAARLFDEAAELQRQGRPDAALGAYRELIAGSPTGDLRTAALLRAARLHYQLGQNRDARGLFEQLLAADAEGPHAAEALAALGAIDAAAGLTPEAARSYRELLEKSPQSPQAPAAAYWLARTSADELDTVQARRYVRWLQERLDPEQYSATSERKLWAQAVCLECQLAASARQWNEVQDVAVDALAHLSQGADRARVEFWQAEAEFRTGQFAAAREHFAALDARTAGIVEPWVAVVPLRRAQLAARRAQWSEVLKFIERIDRHERDFPFPNEVEYLRGRALAGRGDMEAARAAYQQVLNHAADGDPETAVMAQWMIAETYFQQRAYPQARAAYQALADCPASADWLARAALAVGKCWELEGRWDEARAVYERALADCPNPTRQPEIAARLKWAQENTSTRR